MNKIRDLLRKIMALLDSSDLTNTEERKKLEKLMPFVESKGR